MKRFPWTIRLSLLMPLLLFIAVLLMGGGHGWYEPAMILFPFGLLGIITNNVIAFPFWITGLLQYPLYGLIIDLTKSKKITLAIIVLIHILTAVTILLLAGDEWR